MKGTGHGRRFNPFALLILAVLHLGLRLLWRLSATGREHLPDHGPYLIVANHVNKMDGFMIQFFLKRPIRFMASDELFRRPFPRFFFGTLFWAFSKRRWSRDLEALRKTIRFLAEGQVVGIFPEGARNWDGGPVKVDDEAYRFIKHCRVPVVPVSLLGAYEAMPRWALWRPAAARVTVKFFPPLYPRDYHSLAQFRAVLEERIFAAAQHPPVARGLGASHRRLPVVAWACLRCGQPMSLTAVRSGLVCRSCGATWEVRPDLLLVDSLTGESLRSFEYHERLKERLTQGEIIGGLEACAFAKAYRVVEGKIHSLGTGLLSLDQKSLRFTTASQIFELMIPEIQSAFLNFYDHLVVSDKSQTLEVKLREDSPVRWEDYLGAARCRPLYLWKPEAGKQSAFAPEAAKAPASSN